MAYSPTNTFSDGATVDIDKINENFQEARDYLNAGVAIGDFDSTTLTSEDFLSGEPLGVTEDYLFTSGDMYTARDVNVSFNERSFYSATAKGSEPYGWELHQPIPECGKRIYLENTANLIIEAMCCPLAQHDYKAGVDETWIAGDTQKHVDDNIWLEIDGVVEDYTKSYTFEELFEDLPTAGGVSIARSAYDDHAWYQFGRSLQRPFFCSFLEIGLSKGWHDIRLVYNSRNAKSAVRARQMTIEVFYTDTNN